MRHLALPALLAILSFPAHASFGSGYATGMLASWDSQYDLCQSRLSQLEGYRDVIYIRAFGRGVSVQSQEYAKALAHIRRIRASEGYKNAYKDEMQQKEASTEEQKADSCRELSELVDKVKAQP